MMNKRYQSGRNFEYRVKKKYEDVGMFCIRSAGSHSPVDIVCFDTRVMCRPLFIQCKADRGSMTQKEKSTFREFSAKYYAQPIIAHKNDKGHIEIIELD